MEMKSRWIAVLCLLVLVSVPVLAQEKGQEKPPAGMPDMNSPEMQAAMASSTALSTTSCARWSGRSVNVYMPGRLRTGSSPVRTSMAEES